jgi:hypothetical protein
MKGHAMHTIRRFTAAMTLVVAIGALLAATASAKPAKTAKPAAKARTAMPAHALRIAAPKAAAAAEDDEVILPSRVANAITRAQNLLDGTGTAIDTGDSVKAVAQLKALQRAVTRIDKAARRQMNAPVDPDAEEGATTGPDSVIGALTFEQAAITTLAGYFDTKSGTVVDGLTHALFATMNTRGKLVDTIIGLDPEGAGADFADGMADTVAGYDDEVANLNEALSDDTLSVGGKKVLQSALTQATATQTKINAAFGGGE